MSETPKENSQSFSDYSTLIKKIEKLVDETPDKGLQKEIELTEEKIDTGGEISEATQKEVEMAEVTEQTLKLEESITEVAKKEAKQEFEKLEDLIRLERELIETYSGTKVQITDFYHQKEEKTVEEIKQIVKEKIHSVEGISILSRETYGFPFTLCKIEGKMKAIVPIEIEEIRLPTVMINPNRHFKLSFAGNDEVLNLSEAEREIWNHTFNQFQIKLTRLLNKQAKGNLSKKPQKMKLVELDSSKIKNIISEYKAKVLNIQNYQNEILLHLNEIKKYISEHKTLWKNKEEYEVALEEIRVQLQSFEKKQKEIGKETQIEFIKLKRTQKFLDARTKKYKLNEKRDKKITRDEKEELIKEVREFQRRKILLRKNIDYAKKLEETLIDWVKILELGEFEQANERIVAEYSYMLLEKISQFLETKDVDSIVDDSVVVDSDLENITIHVVYIPTSIYTFKAKKDGKKIEGKILYLTPTKESIMLNPIIP